MFLEVTKTVFLKLKPSLEEHNIGYQLSDCSINGEKDELGHNLEYVHLEFGDISKKTASFIAKLTDKCYGLVADESKKGKEIGKPMAYVDEKPFGFEDILY